MPNYRRNRRGEYFFFTLVTQARMPIFAGRAARRSHSGRSAGLKHQPAGIRRISGCPRR